VDALTREVQEGFKRMDGEIRAMGAADRTAGGGDDDAQVWVPVAGGATEGPLLGLCRLACASQSCASGLTYQTSGFRQQT
jgi:hypothetical protein